MARHNQSAEQDQTNANDADHPTPKPDSALQSLYKAVFGGGAAARAIKKTKTRRELMEEQIMKDVGK